MKKNYRGRAGLDDGFDSQYDGADRQEISEGSSGFGTSRRTATSAGRNDETEDLDEFDGEIEAGDLEELTEEVESTDDPVRMYLMQMGQIPLLNRAQEISSAKQIERTRLRYRHSMLATDYVLQGAVELLEKVRDGKLRLDRTIEISVTNTSEKKKVMKRIVPNLETLNHLLIRNQQDYCVAI